jgi:cytochrome c553
MMEGPVNSRKGTGRNVRLVVVCLCLLPVWLVGAQAAFAQSDSVQRGAHVFNDNCQICHGVYAQGRMGPPLVPLPPPVASMPRDALVEDLTGLIRGGIPGRMPMFPPGLVADQDVGALVDWFLFMNAQPRQGASFYDAMAPVPAPADTSVTYVAATKHTISGAFKQYYDAHGGADQFGNPLTEQYFGYSEIDASPATMQLFERARFALGSNGAVSLSPIGSAEVDLRTHFLGGPGGPEGGMP